MVDTPSHLNIIDELRNKNKLRDIYNDIFNDINKLNANTNTNANKKKCINNKCITPNIQQVDNTYICKSCKTIIEDIVSNDIVWKNTEDSGDSPCHGVMIDPLLVESSYSTNIKHNGNPEFMKYSRIQTWSSMPYYERSKKDVFDIIKNHCRNGEFPDNVYHVARNIYNITCDKTDIDIKIKTNRGDNRNGLICACIYKSLNLLGISRSTAELSKVTNMNKSDINNGITILNKTLKAKNIIIDDILLNPMDFIERYCNLLNIDKESDILEITRITKKVHNDKYLITQMPESIACACIYLYAIAYDLCDINKFKNDIVEKCDISLSTLINTYGILNKYTSKIL
jgi:transcription initiation factor TFIIIB Brf1 subunit/transcription initiation factor TFIIB